MKTFLVGVFSNSSSVELASIVEPEMEAEVVIVEIIGS
jgi:hypothetical protein